MKKFLFTLLCFSIALLAYTKNTCYLTGYERFESLLLDSLKKCITAYHANRAMTEACLIEFVQDEMAKALISDRDSLTQLLLSGRCYDTLLCKSAMIFPLIQGIYEAQLACLSRDLLKKNALGQLSSSVSRKVQITRECVSGSWTEIQTIFQDADYREEPERRIRTVSGGYLDFNYLPKRKEYHGVDTQKLSEIQVYWIPLLPEITKICHSWVVSWNQTLSESVF